MKRGKKCVFFDRDGIVNESPGLGYVESWDEFRLLPQFVAVARIAAKRGYVIAIATNQRGVARGLMTHETLTMIHDRLEALLRNEHGIELLQIYCCTHERDTCDCRKPQPGMLLQAADEHGLDLASSWMIGDNETDVETGNRAGCRTILVGRNADLSKADFVAVDMDDLTELAETVL